VFWWIVVLALLVETILDGFFSSLLVKQLVGNLARLPNEPIRFASISARDKSKSIPRRNSTTILISSSRSSAPPVAPRGVTSYCCLGIFIVSPIFIDSSEPVSHSPKALTKKLMMLIQFCETCVLLR
jgi:hypothetical protein